MPEGPEVRTVARTLAQKLVGLELGPLWHSSLRLRRNADYQALKRLEHQRVDDVYAYGKVLFISAGHKPVIMAQLGMTGQLKVENKDAPLMAHTHVRWQLAGSDLEIRYVDPRRFGLIDRCDEQVKAQIIAKLGPDPFTMTKADFPSLIKTMAKSTRSIKEILLDQSVLVGVGNIYASEALFRAGIHPERRGVDITTKHYDTLIKSVIDVLNEALKNSGTSFSNYVDGTGLKGNNQAFLRVFQREKLPCTVCKTPIARLKQNGRSSFFCPRCQS